VKPGARLFESLDNRGEKLGSSHQVNIVSSLLLKLQKDFGQSGNADFFSITFTADPVILAEAAAERTAGEKYSSASVNSAETGFLPLVESSSGSLGNCAAATEARSFIAVDTAASGAETAVFICGNSAAGIGS